MPNLVSYTQKVVIAFALAMLLTACGGGSSDGSGSVDSPLPGTEPGPDTPTTASVTLNWMPPTQNTDNSVLEDLSGYKIYYGTSQSSLDTSIELTNAGLTSYVVDNLTAGITYYFAVTAVNSSNIESAYSQIARKDVTG